MRPQTTGARSEGAMMADWERATSKDGGFAEEMERIRHEALRGNFERQLQIGRAAHSQHTAGIML